LGSLGAFDDDFNRTNGPSLGPNWIIQAGNFLIQAQQAYGNSSVNLATVTGVSLSDAVVQADVVLGPVDSQFAGVIARYAGQGIANMYWGGLFRIGGQTFAQIYRNLGGVWTLLSSQFYGASSGTVRFEVINDSLKLFVNGQLLTSTFDTAITTPGGAGLWCSPSNRFDNFSVFSHAPLTNASLPYPTQTFTQADGTQLSTDWRERAGGFSVQTNQLATTGAQNLATLNGVVQADVVVQAGVTLTATGDQYAGLVARYGGPGIANMYWGGLYRISGTVYAQIYRNVGGTWTLLSSHSISTSTGSLRFEVTGNSLQLYVDNNLVTDAFDSMVPAAGSVGLWGAEGENFDNFSAMAHAALPATFADAFTQADGTALSTSWQNRTGRFSIQDNQALTNAPANLATVNSILQIDSIVQADVALSATGDQYAGVVARYTGATSATGTPIANMYWGGLYRISGTVYAQIYRNVGGTWTLLSSHSVAAAAGTVRFEVIGNSLQLYFNGILVTDAFDSTLTTAGAVGIWGSQGNQLDTFSVAAHPPLPTTFTDTFTQSDNSALSASWLSRSGNYSIQSDQALSEGAANLATVNSILESDMIVQADVALSATGDQYAGVVARYTGATSATGTPIANMYWGGLYRISGAVYAQIYRNVGGTWTLLSSQAIGATTGTVRFEVIGNSLKLFVNNLLKTNTFDSALTAAGAVGIWGSQGNTLDNFNASVSI
jgi:hypothetical protein